MDDPIFGKVNAGFGTQLRIVATQNVRFLKVPVDSIVLSLRYDTSLFYGKYKEPMDFNIFPLSVPYDPSASYYSNHVLQYDANKKLGEIKGYQVNKIDSIQQLRIPLDTFAFMSILRSFFLTMFIQPLIASQELLMASRFYVKMAMAFFRFNHNMRIAKLPFIIMTLQRSNLPLNLTWVVLQLKLHITKSIIRIL